MACYCDDCGERCDLEDLDDYDGEVLCLDCAEDREEEEERESEDPEPKKKAKCSGCWTMVPENTRGETLDGRHLCQPCMHKYELGIWTPPDHDPKTCTYCTPTAKKAA